MVCSKCGTSIPDGSKTCAKCGLPIKAPADTASEDAVPSFSATPTLPETAEATAPAPKKIRRRILLITGIAAILVVLGVVAFAVIRNFQPSALVMGIASAESTSMIKGEDEVEDYVYMELPLMIQGEDETRIYNGSSEPVTIDGKYCRSIFSMDGEKAVILVDRDDEGNFTIFYYDGMTARELSDDVVSWTISANGNVVAYVTDYDGRTGTLNIYDASRNKSEEVTDGVGMYVILSPDGQSYSYISNLKFDYEGIIASYRPYISVNGKDAVAMDPEIEVIGLADYANYVYYIKWEIKKDIGWVRNFFVRHGNTDTLLGDQQVISYYNQDLSELLFTNSEGTYLLKAAGEKEKISDHQISGMFVPDDFQKSHLSSEDAANIFTQYTVYNVESLAGLTYFYDVPDGSSLSYLDSNLSFSETYLIDSVNGIQWTTDHEGFYYLNDYGTIQYLKDVTDPEAKPEEIYTNTDMISALVSPDPSTVYFFDDEETLWVKHGNDDPVIVANSISENSLTLAADGKGVYFITDLYMGTPIYKAGTLCYLSNEKNAEITEVATNVAGVQVSDFGVVYYVYDGENESWRGRVGEAYYAVDGKIFTKVMENAYIPETGNSLS